MKIKVKKFNSICEIIWEKDLCDNKCTKCYLATEDVYDDGNLKLNKVQTEKIRRVIKESTEH